MGRFRTYLGLLMLTNLSLSACGQSGPAGGPTASPEDQKVQNMLVKIGVPGASAVPSKAAIGLDCPPVKAMLKDAQQASDAISASSRQALNAWARWCSLPPLS